MEAEEWLVASVALVVFVFVSSFLGLSGRIALGLPLDGDSSQQSYSMSSLDFMRSVWATSLTADVVFAAGSVAGAWIAFRLTERRGIWIGFAFALAISLTIYLLSFLTLDTPPFLSADGTVIRVAASATSEQLADSARFVWNWGILGLVFATLAPPIAAQLRLGSEARARLAAEREV